jgi:hypothetical protein
MPTGAMLYIISTLSQLLCMKEWEKTTICSFVVNLQRENMSESDIYKLVADMNPNLGDPLAFYEEFVIQFDESCKNAAKEQKKVAKDAANFICASLDGAYEQTEVSQT